MGLGQSVLRLWAWASLSPSLIEGYFSSARLPSSPCEDLKMMDKAIHLKRWMLTQNILRAGINILDVA